MLYYKFKADKPIDGCRDCPLIGEYWRCPLTGERTTYEKAGKVQEDCPLENVEE